MLKKNIFFEGGNAKIEAKSFSKTLHLPCVYIAFMAKTVPLPSLSSGERRDTAFTFCFHCLHG